MPVSRAQARTTLAQELESAMSTAQVVYDHMRSDFAGQSPVVRVMSGGSERRRFTTQGGRGDLLLMVQIWVLSVSPADNWTEADAENALDQLEWELAQYIDSNRRSEVWQALDFDGRSRVEVVRLEGKPYLIEDIPLVMKVF